MSHEVVPGIRHEPVSRFFAERVPGADGPLLFELISGGKSNLTYRVTLGERCWVLRRPPLGHVLPTAHDMSREFRVLSALADSQVPVPRTIALCSDERVNEMPFYVMEYRPGVVLDTHWPETFSDAPADCRAISQSLVAALVALHGVDFAAVGLAEFGRPEGYLERQLRRWSQQWERSKTREVPEVEALQKQLAESTPKSPAPTIVHGDYRLGNMALDPEDPGHIVAIFDWEMSTLGDPLADLGYTLIYWGDRTDPGELVAFGTHQAITTRPGFMKRAELVEAYARASGRDVSAIDFYQKLALYKLAVISEGIYARFLQGKTVGAGFDAMTQQSPALARRALEIRT